jgi:protein-S-isoprenylcysteine O-methyltransferase Ste14
MFPFVFEIGIWNAWIFMSVFLLQTAVMILAGKRVMKRSHVPAEARRTRSEHGTGMVGNVLWLMAMGYSVFLPFRLGTLWFYAGLSVFLAGFMLMSRATIDFIRTPGDQVMAKGAYSLSRHPLYLATLLIYLGSGIASASWVLLLITIISGYCFRQEALIEERYCLEVYGRPYGEYMNRTPRWAGVPYKGGS